MYIFICIYLYIRHPLKVSWLIRIPFKDDGSRGSGGKGSGDKNDDDKDEEEGIYI